MLSIGWNELFVFVWLLTLIGSIVQGSIGFGLAVVASPIFVLIDPRLVPVSLLVNALVISLINSWLLRKHVVISELGMAVVGRIPGTLLAVWLLTHVTHRTLAFLVGGSVMIAVVLSSIRIPILVNRRNALIAGFFSGIMGTTSGIGGPPMALLYQREEPTKARANLSLYFSISCVISLTALASAGQIDRPKLELSLALVPAALLGTALARPIARAMSLRYFRLVVLILCSISAIGVLYTAWEQGS